MELTKKQSHIEHKLTQLEEQMVNQDMDPIEIKNYKADLQRTSLYLNSSFVFFFYFFFKFLDYNRASPLTCKIVEYDAK